MINKNNIGSKIGKSKLIKLKFDFVWQLRGGEGIAAIKKAIDIGYRHFDTAFLYNTEQEVGEAIRDKIAENVITRADVFVVTKVWAPINIPEIIF